MRSPMTARSRVAILTLLAATSFSLVACAGDSTAPKAAPSTSQLHTSPFVPTGAQKALVGAIDGTYIFTVDPTQDQSLALGASRIDIPANSVCELATSSYGAAYWNDQCTPESAPLTITAVVRDAGTDHPSVEFQPAMRFSPDRNVNLYLYVTDQATLDNGKVMKYCNEFGCVDESISDPDLVSNIDVVNRVVFRRIKHFSGYVVTNNADAY
jgi:hypothetical protein